MDTLEEQLAVLGISTSESRAYLTLVELGRSYVSMVAKRSGMPRVNCYHTLDNLARKGVISVSLHKGKKMYRAESPEILVKQQVERLRIAEKVLPELKQLSRAQPAKISIRPLEGKAAIKSVFEETLTSADEILGYTNVEKLEHLLKDYLYYYAQERMQRKIRSRLMSPYTKSSKDFLSTYYSKDVKREFSQMVFVEPGEFPFDSEVYIYGNKVATFSLNPKELVGVVVESLPFVQTYRSIFNLSWLGATSFIVG